MATVMMDQTLTPEAMIVLLFLELSMRKYLHDYETCTKSREYHL